MVRIVTVIPRALNRSSVRDGQAPLEVLFVNTHRDPGFLISPWQKASHKRSCLYGVITPHRRRSTVHFLVLQQFMSANSIHCPDGFGN
jgi:hypothetical protein